MVEAWRAVPADLSRVAGITAGAYSPYIAELGAEPVPMTEDHLASIEAGETWLFGTHGLVRAVAVLRVEADHLSIESLAVDPGQQGGGLGRFMLGWSELQARHLGLPELRLLTNDRMRRNIAIYTRAGFIETGRRANPKRPGWISVHMARPVRP